MCEGQKQVIHSVKGDEEAEDAQCTVIGYHMVDFSVLFLLFSNREAILLLKKETNVNVKKERKKKLQRVYRVQTNIHRGVGVVVVQNRQTIKQTKTLKFSCTV